ncbi:kinase [Fusarium mundagurra]|uniref:Kinase n=1 Tax=Fusarium mundagurra TaxID=1567541 RepID=A0A8H6DCD9_9HYPO|nr:kinase [Fusarium mundagurra]
MDPRMSLNHEEALAHKTNMTTQSCPITRSRHPLVRPTHSGADGAGKVLTDSEARAIDVNHESDNVSLRRMKTEGSVTDFAPFNIQASELTGPQSGKQISDKNTRLPTSERIRNALRREPTLGSRIIEATVQSAHPDYRSKKFLPRTEIQRLLTTDSVEKELTQCKRWRRNPIIGLLRPRKPNFQEEAQIICGKPDRKPEANPVGKTYQKIFAILVLLKRASSIVSFLHKVCDDDLPLRLGDKVKTNVLTVITKNGEKVSLYGFRQKQSFYDKFIEKQWLTSNDTRPAFAVKKIRRDKPPRKARIDPNHEAVVSRDLKDRHPNLISLLATYKHHGDYHFIFPWAEADLKGYWETINPKPWGADRDATLKWLGIQCQGLADGLSSIHLYSTASSSLHGRFTPPPDNISENADRVLFGRHGDIKPENILWYPEIPSTPETIRGILKITDFGFSEFSSKPKVDRERRGFIANSPSYRAPEIDMSTGDGLIGPSYDVWALGCIYLEFLAWWLGGWDYVQSFAERRLDYDVAHWKGRTTNHRTDGFFLITNFKVPEKERVEVRKSVKEFMDEAHDHRDSNDLIRAFIELIRTEMLVVESQLEKRSTSESISSSLATMLISQWGEMGSSLMA